MKLQDELSRELEEIEERYRNGEITLQERNKQSRDAERWYRNSALDAAEDAARQAYDRELERW